jgi:hypothetical protein
MAGDQVPVMLLLEVVGKGLIAEPTQIGATALNVGVSDWLTLMVTMSVIVALQVLVAVSVNTIVPEALAGKV